MYLHKVPVTCELVVLYYIAMKYEIDSLPNHRARLASVLLRAAKEVVVGRYCVSDTRYRAAFSGQSSYHGGKQQGWLRRIGHGLYVPVPLDLAGSEQVIADPWVLVPTLFNPMLHRRLGRPHIIGKLTEQLFNEDPGLHFAGGL